MIIWGSRGRTFTEFSESWKNVDRIYKINFGDYLNFENESYINDIKAIYFITNYFIQLSSMLLGRNTVNEFYLKPVQVKSKNRPYR